MAGGMRACQTAPEESMLTADEPLPEWIVQPETVLPPSFSRELAGIAARDLNVPPTMLTVAEVARPRAELRAGPGVQFELGDALLTQGTPVICFGRVGVWQRVLVPGTWQKGWVHHQALASPKPSDKRMTVPHHLLPTVLAVRPIGTVMSYPQRHALKVSIPTGTMFRTLTQAGGRVLVWVPETNSVMWIAHTDVQ
jgi:hypothetical protein